MALLKFPISRLTFLGTLQSWTEEENSLETLVIIGDGAASQDIIPA